MGFWNIKFLNKDYNTTPKTKDTVEALWNVQKIILETLDFHEVVQKIVDSILLNLGYLNLGYRIVVLILHDKKTNTLQRVSISQTAEAKKALTASPIPFRQITIPLEEKTNICVQAFTDKKPYATSYWPELLSPAFKKDEAIAIQNLVGIKTSLVYPLTFKNESVGVLIFSMVKHEKDVTAEEKELIAGFTDIVSLAVQNSRLYTTLGETTKQLSEANEQLKELDKIKDEFVYMASHELRTPMTAIKNYLWLALNKHKDKLDESLTNDLNRAFISTERLIRLVQDMLTVSRIEGNRLVFDVKPVKIEEAARQIVDELSPVAREKNLNLTFVPPTESFVINGDHSRIMEVLQNFIGNSLKFTPTGGTITVSIRRNNGMIEASVSDTGVGIPKEDLPRLFQKFGRLGHSYKRFVGETGTGLGLFITKQIVEAHGGKILVSSEVDHGSTFTVVLPEYRAGEDSVLNSQSQTLSQNNPQQTLTNSG